MGYFRTFSQGVNIEYSLTYALGRVLLRMVAKLPQKIDLNYLLHFSQARFTGHILWNALRSVIFRHSWPPDGFESSCNMFVWDGV